MIKIEFKNNINNGNYICIEKTTMVNGIFVILVFLSHVAAIVDVSQPVDKIYMFVKNNMNQMVVAPFLFFSGYGIMESYKKREIYISNNFLGKELFVCW